MTNACESDFSVLPLYGQIFVGDSSPDTEYPQFVTGEEAVVTSAYAVVVATRSDADGPVTVRVRTMEGGGDETVSEGLVIFDGELLLPSRKLLVGSHLAQQFRTFDTPSAVTRVRVDVDTPGLASVISVATSEAADPA